MRRMMVFLLVCSAAGVQRPGQHAGPSRDSDKPGGGPRARCGVATKPLAWSAPTPGSLAVTPSEKGLVVTCTKPGWQTAVGTVDAVYKGIGFGQLLSGGAAAGCGGCGEGHRFPV